MEPKKTEKADLTNKSGLFFSIGLAISMSLIVMAFEYKKYDESALTDFGERKVEMEEIMEPPPTDIPPPPPVQQIQQPQIVEVPDDEEIEEEIEINMDNEVAQDTKVEEISIQPVEIEKEDPNEIFIIVEEGATFPGGYAAFYDYVNKKLNGKYPAQARRMGIEGRVYVEFVVNKDGSVVDVKTQRGIGAGCDELAEKVIRESPAWKPGKQRGKAVRQRMVLPIMFKLN